MSESRLLTVKQAVQFTNCAVWCIREWMWSGQLAYVQAGRRFLIDSADLGKLVVRLKEQPRVPVSRNEYLDRRAKLWSLIQGIDPETADLEEIAAEKTALDAYKPTESQARARRVLAARAVGTK